MKLLFGDREHCPVILVSYLNAVHKLTQKSPSLPFPMVDQSGQAQGLVT